MVTEDSGSPGLRERKKSATRAALSWAAVRLAVEHGFANVRAEDIAAEVGISTRTFNNYFAGKAEAIAAHQADRAHTVADTLRRRPAGEPLWDAIAATMTEFVPGSDAAGEAVGEKVPDPRWVAGVRLMIAEPALRGELLRANALIDDELAGAIADRTGADPQRDMFPQLAAQVTGAAVQAAIGHWLRAHPPLPLTPLVREALDRVRAGLPAP